MGIQIPLLAQAIHGIMITTGLVAGVLASYTIAVWITGKYIYCNKAFIAAIILGTISIILPDKQTIYIAGLAHLTEQALVNPDVRESIGIIRDRILK